MLQSYHGFLRIYGDNSGFQQKDFIERQLLPQQAESF